jgi:hypothetical protein
MPRQARLDAVGPMHHVMGRGIEQGLIFRDDHYKEDFIERISEHLKSCTPLRNALKLTMWFTLKI